MTTHAPRVPFAPLDNPRLQHLANAKNRQNGLSSQKSSTFTGKSSIVKNTSPSSIVKPSKRSYEPSIFEDYDSENVDPSIFDSPPKKSKSSSSDILSKPFTFTLTSTKSMPPPSAFPFSTPIKSNISAPRTPMTAPAGRSPKRKIANISKNRRVSAPFSRIDPPFAQRSTSALPFSLDAALSGSLSSSQPRSAGATIQESMPKNWFFEIYEDTPEEEAANLMEHSTLTLDLSSDDEGGKREEEGRGKENTPPEGYDGPGMVREVSGERRPRKVEVIRKKVDVGDMDDGERSPLSALETDAFIPEGLDKESHVVVEEGVDVKEVVEKDVVETKEVMADEKEEVVCKKIVQKEEDKSEVVVWQDAEK